MFQIHRWPNAILHLDGDAFFASVIQAVNPSWKNKPVVVGKERGIATAFSYEAKKYGVKRGMRIFEIKKICPDCLIVESDYQIYSLFSQKIFSIMRQFSPLIEEYSIDEGFTDLKGLRRPLNMSYREIAAAMKEKIEKSLGITVSVGLSLTKSLAKIASSFRKPSGLTIIDGPTIEAFLEKTALENIWGIGINTGAYLRKIGLKTALDFAKQPENFIKKNLTKPFFDIWQELRGNKVYDINPLSKESYKSITKSETFAPPTNNPDLLWSRLLNHIEDAFSKARHFDYYVGKVIIFLKTQSFSYLFKEIKLIEKVKYPYAIRDFIKDSFNGILNKRFLYRTTGCTITDFHEGSIIQPGLFQDRAEIKKKIERIYPLYEAKKIDFGTNFFDRKKEIISDKDPRKLAVPFLDLNTV